MTRFLLIAAAIFFGSLGFSQDEVVFRITSPISQEANAIFNTIRIELPKPIAFNEKLAFKGKVRIESEAVPIYLAHALTSEKKKKGFLKSSDSQKEVSFLTFFKQPSVTSDSASKEAWGAEDKLSEFTVYVKFPSAVKSKLVIEELSILMNPKSQPETASDKPTSLPSRDALFKGTFEIKKELAGVHPRLFTDKKSFDAAIETWKKNPASFQKYLPTKTSRSLTMTPVAFKDAENGFFAGNLSYLAAAYRLTGDAELLKAIQNWYPQLENFEPIVINPRNPTSGNKDLSTGAFLMGTAALYDLTKGLIPEKESALIRDALVKGSRQAYESFSSFKEYHYEQNHLIIPICGLGLAAMTLADEVPEAKAWGVFARNLLDRCFPALAHDGWFFEGLSYWNFTIQFPLVYASALRRTTGEDLIGKPPFQFIPDYLAHQFLPDPNFVFDFADWGPRVETDGVKFQKGYDQPWHSLPTRIFNFIPVLMFQETKNPLLGDLANAVLPLATNLAPLDQMFFITSAYAYPSQSLRMKDRVDYPPFHYFDDMEVVHWRNKWSDPNATAIAFKSGPPAGHRIAALYPLYPEWKPGLGHAHPDAGSFILFSKGVFLANDTGYTGKKETADHNSILVDGIGQHQGGTPWSTFNGKPYDEYNAIRMTNVWLASSVVASTAIFEAAYADTLKLKQMNRHLLMVEGKYLFILDNIRSDEAHAYEWRLHSDKEAREISKNKFSMENDRARLVVQNLLPVEKTSVDPTIVETELYDMTRSRTQQRGFHIALVSPKQKDYQFLTAMTVQNMSDQPEAFSAVKAGENKIEVTEAGETCTAWIRSGKELAGTFGYVLSDSKGIRSVGFSGKSLTTDFAAFTLKTEAQVVIRPASTAGEWSVECSDGKPNEITIEMKGQSAKKLTFR